VAFNANFSMFIPLRKAFPNSVKFSCFEVSIGYYGMKVSSKLPFFILNVSPWHVVSSFNLNPSIFSKEVIYETEALIEIMRVE
jgi:hypothetical protein